MDLGKELITDVVRMSVNEQKVLLEHYAKESIDFKIKVHFVHRMILNMAYDEDEGLKEKYGLDVLSYISLLLAIKCYCARIKGLVNGSIARLSFKEIVEIDIQDVLKLMK
jgi:hypothetical protein